MEDLRDRQTAPGNCWEKRDSCPRGKGNYPEKPNSCPPRLSYYGLLNYCLPTKPYSYSLSSRPYSLSLLSKLRKAVVKEYLTTAYCLSWRTRKLATRSSTACRSPITLSPKSVVIICSIIVGFVHHPMTKYWIDSDGMYVSSRPLRISTSK